MIGLALTAIGIGNFFYAFANGGMPSYFWCAFLGIPMTGVGLMLAQFGFLGALVRYQAGEVTPVVTDTFNDLAEGTQTGVRSMSKALGQGLSEGLGGGSTTSAQQTCPQCQAGNDVDARFCDACGSALAQVRVCAGCRKENDPQARFCDQCGKSL